jgi:GH24 family phage-related lysozyme (muramidase)
MKERSIYIGILLFAISGMILFYLTKPKPEKVKTIIHAKIITEKDKLICIIKKYETFSPKVYKLGKSFYQGYGHKVKNNKSVWTEQMATDTLLTDLSDIDKYLLKYMPELTYNQKVALSGLIYNIGITEFLNSSLFIDLAGGYPFERDWFDWHHFKGKDNRGLMARRIYELNLFLK